jgi:peptidoglycan/xylan/chitin deacetylase (PgdA/CDA1 family)
VRWWVVAACALLCVRATVLPGQDEIDRGDPDQPNLALVFNVGAGYEPATRILEVLAEHQQHVTFFVMGWWADRHPDGLR